MKTQANNKLLVKIAALVAVLALPGMTLADEAASPMAQRAVYHTTPRASVHHVVVAEETYDPMTVQPDRAVRTSAVRFNLLDGEPIR